MPFDLLDFHRDWSVELAERITYWRGHLLRDPCALATIDFETRSVCDLKKHGSWVYSKHPTTEAMCLAFHLPGDEEVGLWHAGYEDELIAESELPLELFAYILAGGAVEAHNAFFERVIWLNVMAARHGWPEVPSRSWRCSASRASACALPRDLENAGKAMGLGTEKDMDGRKLMLKMSKPRQPRKLEIEQWMLLNDKTGDYRRHKQACIDGSPTFWHFTEEDFYRLCLYCKQDVRTEMALSEVLPQLSDTELQVWFLDQEINERGARFDRDMATIALDLAEQWKAKLNAELFEITGVQRATQRQQVKDWLEECEAIELPNTTTETMDWFLDNVEMSGRARRVLYIMKQVNRTSTRKYQAALDKTDPDDWRARDLLMYHGANTGRWCLPGDAEVLTPKGWEPLSSWVGGKIMQWDTEGFAFFSQAEAQAFKAPRQMYRVQNDYCDLLTTAEHRWPTSTYYKPNVVEDILAEELEDKKADRKVPCSGTRRGTYNLSPAVRTMLMVQADGHLGKARYHTYLQLDFSKTRKIERCRDLLTLSGLEFKEYSKRGGEVTSFVVNNPPEWIWEGKRLGPWLLMFNAVHALEEIGFWDGNTKTHKGMTYSSVEEENARWVQTLAHLAGKAARVTLDEKRIGNQKPIWRVYVRDKTHFTLRKTPVTKESFEEDLVYCPATKTGYFLVRQNGHILVTGNSGKGIQVQNLPRGSLKDMDQAVEDILEGDLDWLEICYGDVMELLSSALRGMIMPREGHDLIVADYSAIEARCVLWEAGAEDALKVFRTGGDIYCLTGDTEVLTAECGAVRIDEVQRATLLDGAGRWVECDVHCHGEQDVYEVELRSGNVVKRLMASAEHAWISNGHRVETRDLKRGSKVDRIQPAKRVEDDEQYSRGVVHGIVYGDGSRVGQRGNCYRVGVYSHHDDHVPWLKPFNSTPAPYRTAVSSGEGTYYHIPTDYADGRDLKALPDTVNRDYLLGFMRGWLMADGTVSTQPAACICTTRPEGVKWAHKWAPLVGWQIAGVSEYESSGDLTKTPKRAYRLNLHSSSMCAEDFLIEMHKQRWQARTPPVRNWSVRAVNPSGRQKVYCPVVPTTHSFALASGVHSGNCDMAMGIYGYPVNKKEHPDERQFGKQAVLGLGYQMGFITFLLTCRKYKISFGLDQVKRILGAKFTKYNGWVQNYLFPEPKDGEAKKSYMNRKRQATKVRRQLTDAGEKPAEIVHELALMKYTVDVYRTRYGEVKAMWNAQEAAALSAVRQWEDLLWSEIEAMDEWDQELYAPRGRVHMAEDLKTPVGIAWRDRIDGPRIECGPVTWFVMGGFLCCELPSGRLLRYRDPMIKASKTSWGETKDALRYWTVVTGNKWARTSTYGGKLVENITQAIARDVMAEAMLRSAETIYDPLMTVHDEMVCEVPSGQGDVKEFEALMAQTESWAEGCPIDAEGGIMARYRK